MKPTRTILTAAAVLTVALLPLLAIAIAAGALAWEPLLAALAFGMLGMAFLNTDAQLKATGALPNGAATTYTGGIDLGESTRGDFLAECELHLKAPALVVGDLADGDTVTYPFQHDTAADFGSVADLNLGTVVQTGAGGAGAAADETFKHRLPLHVKRYVRCKIVNGGAGDASDKTATLQLLL